MARRIVVFGDSWSYGSDLVDPALVPKLESEGYGLQDAEYKYFHENVAYREKHRYSNLLSDLLSIPVENYSEPGISLVGMKARFINWLSEQINLDDTIVIFSTTDCERYSFYSNEAKRWIHSSFLQYNRKDHRLHEMWKLHLTTSSCKELSDYTLKECVMSTRALCKEHNIKWMYAPVFPQNSHGIVDDDYVMTFSMKELMEIEERNGHNIWAWGEHPNELGHKLIAKHLISFMKERKIVM